MTTYAIYFYTVCILSMGYHKNHIEFINKECCLRYKTNHNLEDANCFNVVGWESFPEKLIDENMDFKNSLRKYQ